MEPINERNEYSQEMETMNKSRVGQNSKHNEAHLEDEIITKPAAYKDLMSSYNK